VHWEGGSGGQDEYIYRANNVTSSGGEAGWLSGWGSVLAPSGVQRHGGGWFGLAFPIFGRWQG